MKLDGCFRLPAFLTAAQPLGNHRRSRRLRSIISTIETSGGSERAALNSVCVL
jgi:hypothetical protein